MTSVTTQRSKDDFSRIFDTVAGADGFNRYLINRGMYLNSANISPSMITMYTVRLNDMYTNISFNFYGTIDLWWLVCKMNDINNPFERLNPGTILKILNREYVNSIIYPMMDAAEKAYVNSTVNS